MIRLGFDGLTSSGPSRLFSTKVPDSSLLRVLDATSGTVDGVGRAGDIAGVVPFGLRTHGERYVVCSVVRKPPASLQAGVLLIAPGVSYLSCWSIICSLVMF
jgi:hypothetical protein